MIGQIGCLVQVSQRIGIASAGLYMLGATLGGLALGLALGVLGYGLRWLFELPDTAQSPGLMFLVAGLTMLGGLWDLGVVPWSLPQPIKQLPRHWLRILGPYRTSFLWGLHVGFGRKTRVGYALYYVVTIWIVLTGGPVHGALLLAAYGFSHGLLLLTEVIGIGAGKLDLLDGLFGVDRGNFFFRYSGFALLAVSLFLLTHARGL
jgi:hypothetical protein